MVDKRQKIFCNDEGPLIFYISPCKEGELLRRLISAGGGAITEKQGGDCVVHLVPEGACARRLSRGKYAVSSAFVVKSMQQQRLLPLRGFIIGADGAAAIAAEAAMLSPMGESVVEASGTAKLDARAVAGRSTPKKVVEAMAGRTAGRAFFTEADDKALIKWIERHPGEGKQGDKVWKLAEKARITHHPWSSMQNRWKKYLKTSLPQPARVEVSVGRPGRPGPGPPSAPSGAQTFQAEGQQQRHHPWASMPGDQMWRSLINARTVAPGRSSATATNDAEASSRNSARPAKRTLPSEESESEESEPEESEAPLGDSEDGHGHEGGRAAKRLRSESERGASLEPMESTKAVSSPVTAVTAESCSIAARIRALPPMPSWMQDHAVPPSARNDLVAFVE